MPISRVRTISLQVPEMDFSLSKLSKKSAIQEIINQLKLSDDTMAQIIQQALETHAFPEQLTKALRILHNEKLLTDPTVVDIVLNHSLPITAAKIFKTFKRHNIAPNSLRLSMIDFITQHQAPVSYIA